MQKVNPLEKFAQFNEFWTPKIVGEVNNTHIKLAKFQGEFVWHQHEHEDELFFVVQGRLRMRLHSGDVVLEPGEFLIVPHGVEHCPVAESEEVWVILVEPGSTLNTGNVQNDRTVSQLERM